MTATARPTPQQLLDLPLPDNDAEAATVREYLLALLTELWREESDFDSKRPFGNSGWQYDVYVPMVRAGMVPGHFDEDGDLVDFDEDGDLVDFDYKPADALILAAIKTLGES